MSHSHPRPAVCHLQTFLGKSPFLLWSPSPQRSWGSFHLSLSLPLDYNSSEFNSHLLGVPGTVLGKNLKGRDDQSRGRGAAVGGAILCVYCREVASGKASWRRWYLE